MDYIILLQAAGPVWRHGGRANEGLSGMRRAIIHVGMSRTATTSLQGALAAHRSGLTEAGILYPDLTPRSAAAPHLSHQHLGEALDGRRPARERTELLDLLRAALRASRADTLLLSYEKLAEIPPRRGVPALLRDVLAEAGCAMEVLVTVKPQAEQLNSLYTHATQFLRERRGFAAWLAAREGARVLDYAALLEPWHAAAAGRVHAVGLRDPGADTPAVARMLEAVGLGDRVLPLLTPAELHRRKNRSPGPVAVAVSRRLAAGGGRVALGDAAREATRFVARRAREAGLDAVPFQGVTPAARRRLSERYAGSNARFARMAWQGAPWTERVAEAPERPVNEIAAQGKETGKETGEETGEAAVAALLDEVCREFGVVLRPGVPPAAWEAAWALRSAVRRWWG
ncbi:hypothetical protein M0638_04070 [Roseomonas sp. NAR14]|uniref:Sulfotransferase family protein n=1 Tax=Roseomonas acroporae TaxID=2937791 RepID=A0A9X1YBQ3_9PROT|nr:hypothetical protein [Roseomonas acroporae]MCK8783556.1 hypothetical protein [Roseomonas acroporae]